MAAAICPIAQSLRHRRLDEEFSVSWMNARKSAVAKASAKGTMTRD
jgi:hypothetical protein